MILNKRKIIGYLCYYIIPSFMLLFLLFQVLVKEQDGYTLVVKYGEFALNLLIIILFSKPLSVIFSKINFFRKIVSYRRELGVLSFWAVVLHSFALFFYLGLFNINELKLYLYFDSFLIWGIFGFIGMFILGITSNRISVMKLKQNWKKLHRIVYLIFLFILIHSYLSSQKTKYLVFAILFIILKAIEIYLNRKKLKR